MTLKFSSIITFVLAFLLPLQAQSEETFKIGVIAPLTGPVANVGECIKNAVLLAQDKEGAQKAVRFLFEDDSFKPAKTVSALQKLISQDKINGLITFGTGTSLAISSIAENKKLPTIALAMSEQVVAGKNYIFRHYPPLEAQNAEIGREVARRNYKRIALITTEQEALLRYREAFLRSFKGMVVADELCMPGETDFGTISAKIKAANPDAVYLLLLPPELSITPLRLREAQYGGDFFGCATLYNPPAIAAANGALEGAWLTSLDDGKAQVFRKAYHDKYGSRCGLPEDIIAYESARLFIAASRSDDMRSFLAKPADFKSTFGTSRVLTANTYELPVAIKRIEEGRFH